MFLADNRAVWRCDPSSCTVTHQGFHGNTTGRSNQSQRCHCSLSVWKQVTRICTHARTRTHAVANGVWCFYHSLCLPNISPVQYLYEVGGNICESDVIAYTHDIVAYYIRLTVIFFLCSCLPPRWASSPSRLRFIGGPQGQSSLWLADQTMTRTISITTCPGELLKCLTTTGVWQSGSCLTKCLTVNLASQYLFSHRTTRATKLPVLPSLNPGSETNY